MQAQKKPFVKPTLKEEASLIDVTLQTGGGGGGGEEL
jgi:hypothetical protein